MRFIELLRNSKRYNRVLGAPEHVGKRLNFRLINNPFRYEKVIYFNA